MEVLGGSAEGNGVKNMNQRRAPSSWGRDTTPGLFWRLQNQRRETFLQLLVYIESPQSTENCWKLLQKKKKKIRRAIKLSPPPCLLLCPPPAMEG